MRVESVVPHAPERQAVPAHHVGIPVFGPAKLEPLALGVFPLCPALLAGVGVWHGNNGFIMGFA